MKHLLGLCGILLAGMAGGSVYAEEGWETYEAGAYGFSMPVPEETTFAEKEWDGGWGGLYANCDGVELFGIALLGVDAKAEEIEKIGVRATGIAAGHWKQIDAGKDKSGWRWYRTVMAAGDSKVAFGGYGVGPAGSYLLLMTTTVEDFEENRSDYEAWYAGVKLGPITAAPKNWKMYKADDFGFRMIVPEGTKVSEKEWDGGWAGLEADSEGVMFYGLGLKGRKAEAEEIEKAGIALTGLAASNWTVIDKGDDRRGCAWYRVVLAEKDGHVIFGGYGVGSKSSYLMLLVTTKEDFKKNERAYRTWYASVTVE